MIRRHPHVFADETARAASDVNVLWERIKAEERAEKRRGSPLLTRGRGIDFALLADIPVGLPALTRALKLQDKAAKVGFDWPTLAPVFDKLKEELQEFEEVALPHDPRGVLVAPSDTPLSSRPEGAGFVAPSGGRAERVSEGAIKEEFGDLLFVLANIARHLKIDPEGALRAANQKFIRRFQHIEQRLAEKGTSPAQSTLDEMDALWDEAKFLEDLDEA